MSFRTNQQGLRIGVRRNLLRTCDTLYNISLLLFRPISPLLFRNDKFGFLSKLPFTFLLLPLAFTLCSCRFNPNLQGKGEIYLQGTWQQDSSSIQQSLITASRYQIRFDCDSFFMQVNYRSKVNYGSDTCRKTGHWAEYIRGAYSQKNDTLFLKGQYCNANFTLKTNADCFNTGPYRELFIVKKSTDALIQLLGTSIIIPVNLNRIKKTVCTQKSL